MVMNGNIRSEDMPIMNTVIAGGGTTPTGTITITSNGITDVTNYANADVQVPTTAPARYVAYEIDGSGHLKPSQTTPIMDFTGVKVLEPYALPYVYEGSSSVPQNLDLSSIETINVYSLYRTFAGTQVQTVDLSGLKTLPGGSQNELSYCFYNCHSLTSVDLSGLEETGGTSSTQGHFNNTFTGTAITTLTFTSLHTIGQYSFPQMINGLTGVVIYFPAVTTFGHNRSLQNMCGGATNTTVHFPSNVQSAVEALNGYPSFGGTNTTLLFDLPATA